MEAQLFIPAGTLDTDFTKYTFLNCANYLKAIYASFSTAALLCTEVQSTAILYLMCHVQYLIFPLYPSLFTPNFHYA